MSVTFIHTADWQIGKPFHSVEDDDKRIQLRLERINAIKRIENIITENEAEFVLVAGDLFDSPTPTKSIVSATCSAIGTLKVPVYVIPGNHDHGGPGSLWEQDFFIRERESLAPNLQVLIKSEPIELEKAILFPCPLLRRHEPTDLTSWLREFDESNINGEKVRIILAHGSIQDFSGLKDDEESDELISTNFIDLKKLSFDKFDYMALGDWHGAKMVGEKAWYAGTHETDRFSKGEDYNPGNVLVVKCSRNASPEIIPNKTGKIFWVEKEFHFTNETMLEIFNNEINDTFNNLFDSVLLKLTLTGSLGLELQKKLYEIIESLSARFLRLKLKNEIKIAPTEEELQKLIESQSNPLISVVASNLSEKIHSNTEEGEVARIALKEIYLSLKELNVI